MHVLLVNTTPIPVYAYGGTERVIWDLGKSLVKQGHKARTAILGACCPLILRCLGKSRYLRILTSPISSSIRKRHPKRPIW